MNRYDAIVIGGGPAGSTTAMLLARAGRSVALVEKSAFPRSKVCGEFVSAEALSLLARAGLADRVIAHAGPEVREVAVYSGDTIVAAAMPRAQALFAYGRALGRDRLDAILLEAAAGAGAVLYQPWRVRCCVREGGEYGVRIEHEGGEAGRTLYAPCIVAAHGSWDAGGLLLSGTRSRRGSDLLAFKARFSGAALPPARMPLLAFPGGYGGLVESDGGRVSFSCCIRRDALARCRADAQGVSAGAAVLAHVLGACRGAREAFDGAVRTEPWLASGPLRPGIRVERGEGYFLAGNAKGEAHPIVAEGISMAIQSAWLLSAQLASPRAASAIARDYDRAYRRNFAPRIRAAAVFSMLATHPTAAAAASGMLALAPALLSVGARYAGKSQALRTSA